MKKIVLKASAGTGKTYRLSLEYIISLSQGIDFKEILVMTFTKKATAEIKERILTFLKDICEDTQKREEFEKNISDIYEEDFKFDLPKMKKIYKNILRNRDKIKIYTIDAYINMIFKRIIAPYLKIYSYDITLNEKEKYEMLNETFKNIFENKEIFKNFKDFADMNTEKNMDNYIELIKNLLNSRWNFILIGEKLNETKGLLASFDYMELFDEIMEILGEIASIRKKSMSEILKKDTSPILYAEDKKKFIVDNFTLFLGAGTKARIWDGGKVRIAKKYPDKDKILYLRDSLYPRFQENLACEIYNEVLLPYEEKVIKTLKSIYKAYDEIKFREKKLTHSDISNYVFKYLGKEEVGFVKNNRLKDDFFDVMDGKINTIFIDEFQDTSILQWKILKNIIDRCENIICVGDEKQSIYGWRDGERRLFENLENIIDSDVEVLDKSYRSRENVIKYVNMIFKNINPSWQYTEVGYVEREDLGSVETFVGDKEISGIDYIIKTINQKFNENYNSIGIIARQNKTLEEIAQELSKNNIPYTYETKTNINETMVGNIIYNTLFWLVRGDYMSLLNVLRSKNININFKDLKLLIENQKEIEDFIYNDGENIFNFEILEKIKEIYTLYKENHGETKRIIYEIIKKLNVLNYYNTSEDKNDIFNYYRFIRNYKYIDDFVEDYEENERDAKFQKSFDGAMGVKLMTIHKSKGLEFDTVFYYIPKPSRKTNSGMKIYFKPNETYEEIDDFLITHTRYKQVLESLDVFDFVEEENRTNAMEEINNLYVALTRPKKNLFVVGQNEDAVQKTGLVDIFTNKYKGEIKLGNEEKTKEIEELNYEIDISPKEKEYKLEIQDNLENGKNKILNHNLEIEKKRIRGSIVHYFLENIDKWEEKTIEKAKKMTFFKYTSLIGEEKLFEILSDKNIGKIYSSCKEIFENDWDYIHNEFTIYNKNEIVRLDRLMIKKPEKDKKGKIFIADYKTGKYEATQLENYKRLVKLELKKNHINVANYDIYTKYIEIDV